MKYRVLGTASVWIEGVIEASSPEDAIEKAKSRQPSPGFRWQVAGGVASLRGNELDVVPESLSAELADEEG